MEAFLKQTMSTMKKIDIIIKKLNVTQSRSKRLCPSLLTETNLFVNTNAYLFKSLGITP